MKWFKRPRFVNYAGEVEYDYENSVEIHKRHGREAVVISFERDELAEQQQYIDRYEGNDGSIPNDDDGSESKASGRTDVALSNGRTNRGSESKASEQTEVALYNRQTSRGPDSKASEQTEVALYNGQTNRGPNLCCAAGEALEAFQPEIDPSLLQPVIDPALSPERSLTPQDRTSKEEQDGEQIFSIEPVLDSEFDSDFDNPRFDEESSLSLHNARVMGAIRDGEDGPLKRKLNKTHMWIAFFCLTIAAFIGGLVVLLSGRDENESQNANSITGTNSTGTNSTGANSNGSNTASSNSTSSGATISEREAMIRDLLVDTPTDLLSDESTPQAKALQWLSYEDSASLSSDNAEEILGRFALACLYFSTNGAEWTNNLGFLSGEAICNWNDGDTMGVFCEEGSQSPVEVNIVDNNLYGGSFPRDLNYLTGIKTIKLYYNQITGEIPDLSGLVNLEHLDLDGNLLSGVMPTSLLNLPNIVTLYLLNNRGLTGTIPDISSASRLESLSLAGCSITGSIPASLGDVTTLRFLQLKENDLSGTIPSALFALPSLEVIGLSGNRLTGQIPSFGSTSITSISLGSNQLGGPLPDGLADLPLLELFYAHENKLTGTIGSGLVVLPSLQQLWLYDNDFTGDLPDFSGSSSVLEDLFLGGNDLAGSLNDFLATATSSIAKIDLSGNSRIGGSLSSDIGRFASTLKYFNASYCALTGSLPGSSMSELTLVTTFAVAGNELTAQIPTEIGNMVELETLDLSLNAFTGDIPDELSGLTALTYLDVSRNPSLGGDLTSILCDNGDLLSTLAADCDVGDPAQVDCDCCTTCCNEASECNPNE